MALVLPKKVRQIGLWRKRLHKIALTQIISGKRIVLYLLREFKTECHDDHNTH